jgi:hypothetical protein
MIAIFYPVLKSDRVFNGQLSTIHYQLIGVFNGEWISDRRFVGWLDKRKPN